jgi:helix-turn-helix protein
MTVTGASALAGEAAIKQASVRVLPDGRLPRDQAALYLGIKPQTLSIWQMQGKGPPSVMVGGRRFYFRGDLDAFIRGDRK